MRCVVPQAVTQQYATTALEELPGQAQGGNAARWRMAPAAREADRAADRCLISGPIHVLALLLGTKCWSLGHSPCRPTRENSNEEVCTGDFSCRLVL